MATLNKFMFATFLLSFLINSDLTPQVIERKKDPIQQSIAEKLNISIEVHTGYWGLFPNWNGGASFSIVKSLDQYYLFVRYTNLPLNYFDPQHSLIFKLDNKDILKFQPISEAFAITESDVAKTSSVALTPVPNKPVVIVSSQMHYSNDNIYFVYRITREELQNLSVSNLHTVSLVFNSSEVIKEGKSSNESNKILENNTGILGRFMRKVSKSMLEL